MDLHIRRGCRCFVNGLTYPELTLTLQIKRGEDVRRPGCFFLAVGFLAVAITLLLLGGKRAQDAPQAMGSAGTRVHMPDEMTFYTASRSACQQASPAARRASAHPPPALLPATAWETLVRSLYGVVQKRLAMESWCATGLCTWEAQQRRCQVVPHINARLRNNLIVRSSLPWLGMAGDAPDRAQGAGRRCLGGAIGSGRPAAYTSIGYLGRDVRALWTVLGFHAASSCGH
jgi:hypothetical protein